MVNLGKAVGFQLIISIMRKKAGAKLLRNNDKEHQLVMQFVPLDHFNYLNQLRKMLQSVQFNFVYWFDYFTSRIDENTLTILNTSRN